MKKFFYIMGLVSVCGLAESAFLELLTQQSRTALHLVCRRYHVITPGIKPTLPFLRTPSSEQNQETPFPKNVRFLDADYTRFVIDKKPIPFIEPPEVEEQDNQSIRVNLRDTAEKKLTS